MECLRLGLGCVRRAIAVGEPGGNAQDDYYTVGGGWNIIRHFAILPLPSRKEHTSITRRTSQPAILRRILVIAEGGLGDHVALTPALRAMKQSFPGSFLAVFSTHRHPTDPLKPDPFNNLLASQTERKNSVFSTNPYCDELYVLNRYSLRALSWPRRVAAEWSVVQFLRGKKFDTVISTFPHKDRFVIWSLLSGASRRIGARNQGLRWLLTHTPDIEKSEGGVLKYYCELAKAAGARIDSMQTEYVVETDALEWAGNQVRALNITGGQFVAVHPGASGPYKAWPPERFATLIEYLQSRRHMPVIVLKSEMDEEIVAEVIRHMHSEARVVDCSGALGRLAAMIKLSVLCISNDSGPRHLAVAVGTPSLAFFRRHHDKEWDVYDDVPGCCTLKGTQPCPACPPEKCFDRIPKGERYGAYCLRMVSVEAAIASTEGLLADATRDSRITFPEGVP